MLTILCDTNERHIYKVHICSTPAVSCDDVKFLEVFVPEVVVPVAAATLQQCALAAFIAEVIPCFPSSLFGCFGRLVGGLVCFCGSLPL